MEFTVADQSATRMDSEEMDELIYYSDSDIDDQYDAHTSNQADISPQESTNSPENSSENLQADNDFQDFGQTMANVQSDADELNNFQQSASNKPDINANDKQQIQPVIESNNDYEMPCNTNDNPICDKNEHRAGNETQTDFPTTIDLPSTIDLTLDNNEKIVNADVNDVPREAENVARPSVPRVERPRTKINKKQKAVQTTKEYKCSQCEFSTKRKWNLDIHIRAHSGERSFECEYCEKRFKRKPHLKHHMISVHSELFEFHCSKCRLGFQEKSLLTSHETHCSKKQFVCDYCNGVFDHKGHFTNHIRTHSNEMPFHCFDCKKGFARKANLNRHIKCCH